MPLRPWGPASRAGAPISGAANPRAGNLGTANPGGVVIRAVVTAAPFLSLEVQPLADPVEECCHSHSLNSTVSIKKKTKNFFYMNQFRVSTNFSFNVYA